MLLAIAEATTRRRNTTHEQTVVSYLRHIECELSHRSFACLRRKLHILMPNLLFGLGVEEREACRTAHLLVGSVEDARREHALVCLTHEARHVGLNHNGLLRNGCCGECAVVHRLVVCEGVELPCGDALGQCELQLHVALVVCHQTGIEESRFAQVLTRLRCGSSVLSLAFCACISRASG